MTASADAEWVQVPGGFVRKGSLNKVYSGRQTTVSLPKLPKPVAQIMSAVGLLAMAVLSVATLMPTYFWDPSNLATVAMGADGQSLAPADAALFMDGGIKAFPKSRQGGASEFAFLLSLATRGEGSLFVALGAAALYSLSIPFECRAPLHLFGALYGTLAFFVNLNHAGFIAFGSNPFVTAGAAQVASGLVGFWVFVTPCLWGAFSYGLSAKED